MGIRFTHTKFTSKNFIQCNNTRSENFVNNIYDLTLASSPRLKAGGESVYVLIPIAKAMRCFNSHYNSICAFNTGRTLNPDTLFSAIFNTPICTPFNSSA